ncbi:helix-turn-helix domain-containing protein [Streptosporangium sp. KLBMP 9127]|nr:helix-turn-helix domain-containing protein [Streptosporangium sp. KLBMP 9127]
MTIHETATQLEWSTAKISRLENGLTKRPDVHHVRALCATYSVQEGALIDGLVSLAREARQRGWWTKYEDVFTGTYVGLEAEASAISTYELGLIPGLLQTADYATEIIQATATRRQAHEIERRVAARMERQKILDRDDPPQLWAVIDEAALLRQMKAPGVHEQQLRRLIDTSPTDHIKIQILPLTAGPHAGMAGPFLILDFPDVTDRSVVYLETATDSLYLEETDQLARYRLLFKHVCASALSVDASIAYLSNLIDRL